jgi:hypothetical protein
MLVGLASATQHRVKKVESLSVDDAAMSRRRAGSNEIGAGCAAAPSARPSRAVGAAIVHATKKLPTHSAPT